MTEGQALERIKEAVGRYLPGYIVECAMRNIAGVLAEVEQDAYARGYRDGQHDAERGYAGEF